MNEGEKRNCEFQRNCIDMNSFFGKLFSAIYKSDSGNRARLAKGFPEEVEAVTRWQREDEYAQAIIKEFNGEMP